ncbi:MAG: hypothetical protein QM703_27400 [Gemmatales bacterium]
MSLFPRALALVVALLLVCLVAADDFKYPDTTAGKHMADFFVAINSGDQEKAKAYITENVAPAALERRPLKDRLQVYQNIFEETGGIKPVKTLAASDDKATIRAKAKKGKTLELTFDFEPKPPHKLLGVQNPHPSRRHRRTPARQTHRRPDRQSTRQLHGQDRC